MRVKNGISSSSHRRKKMRVIQQKEEYQIMEFREHILKRSGMYIGSIRPAVADGILLASDDCKNITQKDKVLTNDGLERLYIEALSNAVDNVWRSKRDGYPVHRIVVDVTSSTKSGLDKISITNDGRPISVKKHSSGPPIPQVIFGVLHSSSSYDEEKQRVTAGTYGIGIKAVNIFSKSFHLTVKNADEKQQYEQLWTDNMSVVGAPEISSFNGKESSVKIEYVADLERFGFKEYSPEMVAIFRRLAIEAAMYSGIAVVFNGQEIKLKNLETYASLYADEPFTESLFIKSEKAEIFVAPLNQFRERYHNQISFVNGLRTPDGGLHVDAWCEALFRELVERINDKLTKELGLKKGEKVFKVNINEVRKHILIFVSAQVANPEFNSQTKAKLIGPPVEAEASKNDVAKLLKWKLIDDIVENIKIRQISGVGAGKAKRTRVMLEGLSDANEAGKHPELCSLILCEGLSAKTFAEKGIETGIEGKSGHDFFGIYPLRGKPLNVRRASLAQVKNNKVVSGIIEALGFNTGVDYTKATEFAKLRYNRLIILTDADDDGTHIRGLILNLFHVLNPSILLRHFIYFMRTPITTISHKGKIFEFYTNRDSFDFISKHSGCTVRYHKGLGGFSPEEVGGIFGRFFGEFVYCEEEKKECEKDIEKNDEMMNLAFGEDTAVRKKWLEQYDPVRDIITVEAGRLEKQPIKDFINKELIQFSIEDCRRMIPSLVDGFKESQRKVLYVVTKLGISGKKEIKVAQLGGAVAKETVYKHGETNLFDTIIGMAWDFVGSNNVPLLKPIGGFGSRMAGGEDAASARYIHTSLQDITELIFRKEDEIVLNQREDEGQMVEWEFFLPILPMFMINGAFGIATAWSTFIPKYQPTKVVEQLIKWIKTNGDGVFSVKEGKVISEKKITNSFSKLLPWYRGFTGKIDFDESANRVTTYGAIQSKEGKTKKEGHCHIVELPIGVWTYDYLESTLPKLKELGKISDFRNHCTTKTISIDVKTDDCEVSKLNLSRSFTLNNMVLFIPILDENGHSLGEKITKFSSIEQLLQEYCMIRMFFYQRRRELILKKLRRDLDKAISKSRFLDEVINGELKVYGVEKSKIEEHLKKKKYYEDVENNEEESGFGYLFSLRMESYTKKGVERLELEIDSIKEKIKKLEKMKPMDIWIEELEQLINPLKQFEKL